MQLIRKQAGDTLIEVLMAIMVLSVVVVGGYMIANRSMRINQQTQDRSQATKVMEAQFERLKYASRQTSGVAQASYQEFLSHPRESGCLLENLTKTTTNACLIDNRFTVTLTYYDTGENDSSGQPVLAPGVFRVVVSWDENGVGDKTVEGYYRVDDASAVTPGTGNIAVNLSGYSAAITAVEQANYTSSSWAAYQSVVLANTINISSTQAEIDAATQNIINAQSNLVLNSPILVHTGVGTFRVSNYNSSLTYTSSPAGSCILSLSGNSLTGRNTNTNGVCTVTVKLTNGSSGSANYERKAYTYHNEWRVVGSHYVYADDNWCGIYPTPDGGFGVWCTDHYVLVDDYGWVAVRDPTPAGWSDSGQDWYRIY